MLLGGHDGEFRDDVWISADMGETWKQQARGSERWAPRWGHACVRMANSSVVVLLGGQGGATLYNDLWVTWTDGWSWSVISVNGALWSPRFGHTVVVLRDGMLLLAGGWDGSYKDDVWRGTADNSAWVELHPSTPRWPGRWGHRCTTLRNGTRLMIAGGYADGSYFGDVWISDSGGQSWVERPGSGWAPRSEHQLGALPGGRVLLAGGHGATSVLGDVWIGDDDGSMWVPAVPRGADNSSPDNSATMATSFVSAILPTQSLDTWTIRGLEAGGWKWAGGVLAGNGKIYCIPLGADSVLIIDPVANAADATTIRGLGTASDKWTGGVLGQDGKVYGVPRNSDKVLVIDPRLDTVSFLDGAGQAGVSEWRSRASAAPRNWRSICWSPERGVFVAVAAFKGSTSSEGGSGSRVMRSSNGVAWTVSSTGISITGCNNGAGNAITCASTSGITVGMTVGVRTGSGSVVDDTFITSIQNGTTFTTDKFVSGLSGTTLVADNSWLSVCWSSEVGLFVAVSTSGTGNRVMTSPNGLTWTLRVSPADNNWHSVCWSPEVGLFVAVSAVSNAEPGKRVMTSPDGENWTLQSSPDNEWRSVCWAAEIGLFIAVSDTGPGHRVMTSPDGLQWTPRAAAVNNSWFSVAWSPELRLAVAVSRDGHGDRVMTSSDGVEWIPGTSAADSAWFSIAWSAELNVFVAVAGTDRVMTSSDGVSWTLQASPFGGWSAICWAPKLRIFAAVSSSGAPNFVMTSSLEHAKWNGAVLAPNGRVYCIPRSAERVLVIDPASSSLSFIELDSSLSPANTNKWVLGTLGPDGNVYGIPSSSDKILVIDPASGTATDGGLVPTPGSSLAGNSKWEGGILGPDGKIYGVPFLSTVILIIDPQNKTYDTTTITGLTSNQHRLLGGVLAMDGRIYMIPWDRARVIVIDPSSSPPSLSDDLRVSFVQSGKWAGGVLAPDGRIFAVPANADHVLIIRPGLPQLPAWMTWASFNKL